MKATKTPAMIEILRSEKLRPVLQSLKDHAPDPQDPKNGQGRARRAGESARHLQTRARNAARRRRNGSGRGIATPISTVVLRWRPYPTPCDAGSEGVPIRSYWITIQLHHQSDRCHETRTN